MQEGKDQEGQFDLAEFGFWFGRGGVYGHVTIGLSMLVRSLSPLEGARRSLQAMGGLERA